MDHVPPSGWVAVTIPSQDKMPIILKSEFSQPGSGRTVLRKEIKRDGHMNAIFKEIHANFFLLTITNDLFIENAAGFNPTIQHLASNAFCHVP